MQSDDQLLQALRTGHHGSAPDRLGLGQPELDDPYPPERGTASWLEVRLCDATANPHLAIAGLLAAMLLGIDHTAEPPPPSSGNSHDPTGAPRLPTHLGEALDALEADHRLAEVLGGPFVDAFLTFKRDEVARFQRYVTDWEFQEYAEYP